MLKSAKDEFNHLLAKQGPCLVNLLRFTVRNNKCLERQTYEIFERTNRAELLYFLG